MKFNKEEKRWLKKEGLWEKVKEYTKAYLGDYKNTPPAKRPVLTGAFPWKTTIEGFDYWNDHHLRMTEDVYANSKL